MPEAVPEAFNWTDAVTLAVAVLGAALGLLNTWQTISAGRVRLRVRPAHAILVPQGTQAFAIEVVNLSAFAVTIFEVGFSIDGRSLGRGKRAASPNPILLDRGQWPRRLEPREAVTAYVDPNDLVGKRIGRAYARTSCGEVEYGSSPALQQLRRMLAA